MANKPEVYLNQIADPVEQRALKALNKQPIHISESNLDTGYNKGAILIAGEVAGDALALGTTDSGFCIERRNVTAACTGSYLMGKYASYATSDDMEDGFIMGSYDKITVGHLALEVYGKRGRVCVTAIQSGNTSNQFIGVYGAVEMSAHAHALTDEGGCYGVLGTADLATGGALDQPLIGGYFNIAPKSNIAGPTLAVRARMEYYTDYGVEVFCQTDNATAGFHIRATAAADLPVGILFTGENVDGQGTITKALKFAAATNCGIAANTTTLTLTPTSHHMIVDIAGTDHYIPIFDKDNWAD